MRITNPATETVTCDACLRVCCVGNGGVTGRTHSRRRYNGRLVVDGLRSIGTGDATTKLHVELDFCDECFARITAAVNDEQKKIKGGAS